MSDDLVKQSLAELHDIVRCRCHEAYTGRGLHDPNCECDSVEAVKVVADRIEELELEVETWKSRALHQNEVAGRLEAKLTKVEAAIHRIAPYLSASLSELDCGPDYIDACNQVFEADSITLAELTGGKDD